MKPIIEIRNLSKKYRIGIKQPYYSLRDTLTGFVKNPLASFGKKKINEDGLTEDEFWALKDVSFKVMPGEVIGIIGRNGAGKTTLLKLLSRITPPTRGEIILRGRVASLLEVGTGFHPELTGRENIYLNGAILGMKQKEIKKRFDEIVGFSEIEKFLDTPVKHFSSGMYMRLAFAVAAHLEPEILIIDEVLSVGDIQFQRKCLGKMENVAKVGRTVLFVSHNLSAIKQLCPRCLILDNGQIVSFGETSSVVQLYIKKMVNKAADKAEKYFRENLSKEFQILSVRLLNESGCVAQDFECDKPIFIELICLSRRPVPGLYGYMSIVNKESTTVLVSDTCDLPPNCLDVLSPNKYKIIIEIPPRTIGHGDYTIYLNFTSIQGARGFDIDSPQYTCSFRLDDNTTERGNKREGFLSTLLKWEIVEI